VQEKQEFSAGFIGRSASMQSVNHIHFILGFNIDNINILIY